MSIRKLTASEEIVMKTIWECPIDAPTRSEVMDTITSVYEKDWQPQTISTFLNKLVEKHYLRMQRNGKLYKYHVLIPEADYKKMLYKHLIHFWYNGDITAFLLELVKSGNLSKEELLQTAPFNEM